MFKLDLNDEEFAHLLGLVHRDLIKVNDIIGTSVSSEEISIFQRPKDINESIIHKMLVASKWEEIYKTVYCKE